MRQKGFSTVAIIIISVVVLLVGFLIVHRLLKTNPNVLSSLRQNTPLSNSANVSTATGATAPQSHFDCLGDGACPEITIQGDPVATLPDGSLSPFRGTADPSIRKDPTTDNKFWLSYSWPTVHTQANGKLVPAVDIHLASSIDGGKSWQSQGPLWPSTAATDPVHNNAPGYTVHEVSNLLPVSNNGSVNWYGARWTYFVPEDGGYKSLETTGKSSQRMEIMQASTPMGLSTAQVSILGGASTSPSWGTIDTNLSTLSPELKSCDFLEPALYYDSSTLYMSLTCFQIGVVVFSTQPTGDIHSWKWKYNGVLMPNANASKLGLNGASGFTQGELAKDSKGQLVAIMSPSNKASASVGLNHFGCWIFAVQSLDSPSLAVDSSGKLQIVATVTASDLGAAGPGSCGYDPASATGVIIARRHLNEKPATTAIYQTSFNP